MEAWIEQLLGVDTASAGEGTAWKFVAAHPWSVTGAVLFAAFALLFVLLVYLANSGVRLRAGTVAVALAMVLLPGVFVWASVKFSGSLLVVLVAYLGWLLVTRDSGFKVLDRLTWLLVFCRLGVIFLVAYIMLPGWMLSAERTGLPFIVVIVDDSSSMSVVDRYDDDSLRNLITSQVNAARLPSTSRLNQAKSLLLAEDAELLRTLEEKYRLKVYYLSSAARAQPGSAGEIVKGLESLQPTGTSSRLGQGIRSVLNDLRGTPPTAIILFSDGINTEGESLPDVACYAERKGVKLLTVALGSEQPVRDIELHDLQVDEVVFVEDIVYFTGTVTSTGFAGREVQVRLTEKDKPDILAETRITLGPDGEPQPIRLPYRPDKVGDFDYVVEVAEQPRESNPANNRQQRRVSVRKERIRVLLVQSYPNYEFRYLKSLLEREPTIAFGPPTVPQDPTDKGRGVVLQEADPQYAQEDRSVLSVFPVSKAQLFEYDVVLFGDVNPDFLSQEVTQNLVDFVKVKGGGIVFFCGPEYTPRAYASSPLAELFPIQL